MKQQQLHIDISVIWQKVKQISTSFFDLFNAMYWGVNLWSNSFAAPGAVQKGFKFL